MRTLVIYYSHDLNTKLIAENIASSLNADLYRVKPNRKKKKKGIKKYFEAYKMIYHKSKPQLENVNVDFSRYDCIYVGTPVWFFNVAPAIRTLLLDKINDKEVALFYTHNGFEYNFVENSKELIEKKNRFVSLQGFINVKDHQMDCLLESDNWAHRFVI